jgi:hypothetical protein
LSAEVSSMIELILIVGAPEETGSVKEDGA